jgi:prepilin-type N-terminal cleavage/methylation domain-containing protein
MSRRSFAVIGFFKRAGAVHRRGRAGFTLLELCIVLFILALLAGAAMPAMSSAFTEQELRSDAHRLSMMVKTGMIKSAEQNRPYVLDLAGKSFLLQPVESPVAKPEEGVKPISLAHTDQEPDPVPVLENVTMELNLTNVFQLPDAHKKNAWETIDHVTWTFQSADLCPLPRVRLSRGNAWIEMSFNALTGNVEDEATSIP